jgi:rhodanese-related sulfurtransferase
MQDLDAALAIAEDKDVAVAELTFLHRLFDGHGAHGDRVAGFHRVRFGGAGDRGEFVHHDGYRRGRIGADRDLGFRIGFDRLFPALVLGLAGGGTAASIALERLGLDVLEGLVDRGDHVGGLGQSDDVTAGAPALSDLAELKPIMAQEVKKMMDSGATALDVRPGSEFIAAHVPGSVSIPLSGQFASWAGAVLGLKSRLVLIADTSEQVSEARVRLARVGSENVAGYLLDGLEGWCAAGFPVEQVVQITVKELASRLANGGIGVLDVRREAEFQAGHIEGADWHPLDRFKAALPEIPKDAPVAVHCKGGYRSLIACSLLQRAGYHNVVDVAGGLDAWVGANLPSEGQASVAEVSAK